MAIVTDSFSGSGALSANWTGPQVTSYAQASGHLVCTGSAPTEVYWGANTFTGDQYAKFTAGVVGATNWITGPIIKYSGAATGYRCSFGPGRAFVQDLRTNTQIINNASLTIVSGDVIQLQMVGSVLTLLQNGISIGTYTDGSPNTGTRIGFGSYYADNASTLLNFEGGDYGGTAATATTLTGPTSGAVGVASSNFTVGANGTITGTVVVTPSDSGGGGTFTPGTVSISSGSPTGTFTYTPASSGAKTISTTNSGSLSNPSSLTYTASGGGAVPLFRAGGNLSGLGSSGPFFQNPLQ